MKESFFTAVKQQSSLLLSSKTKNRKMMPSSPLNLRRAIIWIGRLVLAGIFIYAGYAKLTMGMRPRPPIK